MEDAELRAYFARSEARSERLEHALRMGLERTDLRFDQVDQRFDQVDQRFDQVDQQFTHVRTDLVELRSYVDERYQHLMDLIAGHFETVLPQINERLDRLEQRT